MRRHQAVDHGKAGQHRQADQDQRGARAPGDGKRDRDSRTKPTSKKTGKTHDQRRAHHGPGHVPLAEKLNQGLRDAVRAPDSAIILPSMVPRPTTIAIWPSVLPVPVSKEETMVSSRIPVAAASASETSQQREERVQLAHRDQQDQPNHSSWRRRAAERGRGCRSSANGVKWLGSQRGRRKRPPRCPVASPSR